jgi:hypothetical protein
MPGKGEGCERKRQLLQDLLQVSSLVCHMGRGSQNTSEPTQPDGRLQRVVSEQQQALLAIESHQQEHGC